MTHLIKFFTSLLLLSLTVTAHADEFFPSEYKQFPYKEGDLLVSRSGGGRYAVNKILKIDRMEIKKGESINIQGQRFVAPIDDYLLIVSASYGASEFDSFDQARAAALAGKWTVRMGHIPNRPPGAAEGQVRVGTATVTEAELTGYYVWKKAFEKGEAGVF
jgi:hypothetical protein